jgi:hypothetical protein
MAKGGIAQSGGLPIQVKAILTLVGIAALVGVGFFVYKKLKKIGTIVANTLSYMKKNKVRLQNLITQ